MRRKTQTQTVTLEVVLKLLTTNKVFTATVGTIAIAGSLAILSPNPTISRTASCISSAVAGGWISYELLERKNGELKSQAEKHKALAASSSAKQSAQELAIRERETALEVRQGHIEALESTYKQRADNAATAKAQREIEAAKRQLNTESRVKIRDAEVRLKAAVKLAEQAEAKLKKAIAHHEQAITTAKQHFQSESDKAILAKQVELDKARQELEAARTDADKARADTQHVRAEFGEYQEYLAKAKADLQRRVLLAADAAGKAVLDEYEKENSAVDVRVMSLADSLRRESLERAALKEENAKLLAPKRCLIRGKQGDLARQIQSFVHRLRTKDDRPVRMHFAGIEEQGKMDVFSFEPIIGTPDDIKPHKAEMIQSLRVVGIKAIAYNGARGCIEFAIQTGAKTKISSADMSRILKPATEFKQMASRWHRVRITGGSESGKSPTAELIAYAIADSIEADLFFHNPVAGSIKAHMSLPQVSSGDEECLAALIELSQNLTDMSNGRKAKPAKFQFHVFDEIDTLIAGSDEAAAAIELIIKRGSHYGIGIALTGQSDAVSLFKGFTHSDMNNLVQIALGENAKTTIEKSQVIDTNSKATLKERADLIAGYCLEKNHELKLIADGPTQDAAAFRYALIKAGNKPVTFSVLPEFGSLNHIAEKLFVATDKNKAELSNPAQSSKVAKAATQNAETQSVKEPLHFELNRADTELALSQIEPNTSGEKLVKTELRLLDLGKAGLKCPYCDEVSSTYYQKRVRKKDSTVQMRCRTKSCGSGGKFRVQIATK